VTLHPESVAFDRKVAFSRNLGLVTPAEAETLSRSLAWPSPDWEASAGPTWKSWPARASGRSLLADPDTFEMANINRQFGATCSSFGRRKTEVSAPTNHDINPSAQITVMEEGIRPDNMDIFLKDAKVVIDGLDAFLIDTRRLLYRSARATGEFQSLRQGPLGFGATLLVFPRTAWRSMTITD
jgi:hypothetical protein